MTISENAWRTGGSRMFVQEGTQVSVDNLLKGAAGQALQNANLLLGLQETLGLPGALMSPTTEEVLA